MTRKIWMKRLEKAILMFAALGFSTQQFLPQMVTIGLYGMGCFCFLGWTYFFFRSKRR